MARLRILQHAALRARNVWTIAPEETVVDQLALLGL